MTSPHPYLSRASSPPPWDQQLRGFEYCKDREFAALFMEQRTGKSRVATGKAAYGYEMGIIDGLLIFAPSGPHIGWLREAISGFLPERVPRCTVAWRTRKMETVASKAALSELLSTPHLAILSVGYDALRTAACKKYLAKFLRKRKLLIVFDEADDLSRPGAKRTITAEAAARWGVWRLVLTGTPAAENPFSLYSITNLLRFGLLGFTSLVAFKAYHAEMVPQANYVHRMGVQQGHERAAEAGLEGPAAAAFAERYARNIGQTWTEVAKDEHGRPRYLHLEELHRKLSAFSFFCTRAECGAQLPTRAEYPFELAPRQRQAYDELRERYRAEVEDSSVTANLVLVRWMRLQQISSGFVPLDREPVACRTCDGTDPECNACEGLGVVLPEPRDAEFENPRLEALEAATRGVQGSLVVWTRFTRDADAVIKRLKELGHRAGRIDRKADPEDRQRDLLAFQAGDLDRMVASVSAAGRGNDFSIARTDVFYSHNWSWRLRSQAQDRVETLTRPDPVTHVDLVALDTVDELIVGAHASKRSVQDAVFGRPRREWIK